MINNKAVAPYEDVAPYEEVTSSKEFAPCEAQTANGPSSHISQKEGDSAGPSSQVSQKEGGGTISKVDEGSKEAWAITPKRSREHMET